jgi:hypothetical protein
MEDPDNKRSNEIVKMPQTTEEAHAMIKEVEKLLNNLSITSGNMAGNSSLGFSFNP